MLRGKRSCRLNAALVSITFATSPWAYCSLGPSGHAVSHTCAESIQGAQKYPSNVQVSKGEEHKIK